MTRKQFYNAFTFRNTLNETIEPEKSINIELADQQNILGLDLYSTNTMKQ